MPEYAMLCQNTMIKPILPLCIQAESGGTTETPWSMGVFTRENNVKKNSYVLSYPIFICFQVIA
jgi:hypothetical protein